jgi:hypothetical protein
MKKTFLITAALGCCLMFCFAIIADLNGKWSGALKTPDGNEFPLNYVFKVDGGVLTGSAVSPQGELPFTNGKTDGTTFSFTLTINDTEIKNSGKYYAAADSIGLDIDYNGNKAHTTLKRSAN